jgi:hypothetical protein
MKESHQKRNLNKTVDEILPKMNVKELEKQS